MWETCTASQLLRVVTSAEQVTNDCHHLISHEDEDSDTADVDVSLAYGSSSNLNSRVQGECKSTPEPIIVHNLHDTCLRLKEALASAILVGIEDDALVEKAKMLERDMMAMCCGRYWHDWQYCTSVPCRDVTGNVPEPDLPSSSTQQVARWEADYDWQEEYIDGPSPRDY